MKVVHPLELDSGVDEALRDPDVTWPVPLVLGLALGQVRQHSAHRRARHGDARAAVCEERLSHAWDDAFQVGRGDEGVSKVLRLLAVVPARWCDAVRRGVRRGAAGQGVAYSPPTRGSGLLGALAQRVERCAVATLTTAVLTMAILTMAHSRSVSSSCEWKAKASSSAM